MYRYLSIIMVLVLALCSSIYAGDGNIIKNKAKQVKVYLVPTKISIDNKDINQKEFDETLKSALKERRSVDFNVVDNEKDADYIVSADIKEYYYSESDPVDMITGAGAIVADMAMKENYARMIVKFSVDNAAKGKCLYNDKIIGTITEGVMPYKDSIPKMYSRVSRLFTVDFSKLVQ